MSRAERPRLLIAATQSGSGKTTITSGIIAALAARGLRVPPTQSAQTTSTPATWG